MPPSSPLRSDMDDPNTTITSQFGHSSQELINLLLTGQAVSNVFNDSMLISGDLTCRGIQQRPAIGYLSQLESLRYCEVGGYYKAPMFPIWVIGSTSHFSVLFGDGACLKESKSDIILEQCRCAFKKFEGGGESGFIMVDKLGEVIDELDLRGNIGGDSAVSTLQAHLEVSGAGIILWDDFWKVASRLMTGTSVESAITDEPPLLITQFGEQDTTTPLASTTAASTSAAASASISTMQSDEELARRLAEEWGTSIPTEETNQKAKSDEDYARELQAQWDAEMGGNNDIIDLASQIATTDDAASLGDDSKFSAIRPPTPPRVSNDVASEFSNEDLNCKPSALQMDTNDVQEKVQNFETYGISFPVFHYNGLRGGCLTPFRVTRLSPEEAVGASIALSSGGGSNHVSSGGGDLEDVVRTKWPSCMFNWLGKSVPSVD